MKQIERLSALSHWFLRIALASVFLYHGLPKFTNIVQMAGMLNMPAIFVFMVALCEAGGSVLILLGGFVKKGWITRLGALLLIPIMLGAILRVHWGQWSFAPSASHPMGGIEFQTVLLLIQLYFLFKGNSA